MNEETRLLPTGAPPSPKFLGWLPAQLAKGENVLNIQTVLINLGSEVTPHFHSHSTGEI